MMGYQSKYSNLKGFVELKEKCSVKSERLKWHGQNFGIAGYSQKAWNGKDRILGLQDILKILEMVVMDKISDVEDFSPMLETANGRSFSISRIIRKQP